MSFGFENEATVESSIIPVAQFFNPSYSNNMGLGITEENAQKANFKPDETFELVDHVFGGSDTPTKVYLTKTPRLLVLTRQKGLFMQRNEEKAPLEKFDSKVFKKPEYKAWGYRSILFIDKNNQPLSEIPFRLKLGGCAGQSFRHNFDYGGNFCDGPTLFAYLFSEFKKQTKRVQEPVSFRSHMIFEPIFEKKKVGDKQKNWACVTTGYKKYPLQEGLISRDEKIVSLREFCDSWGSYKQILREYEETKVDDIDAKTDSDGVIHDDRLEAQLAEIDAF